MIRKLKPKKLPNIDSLEDYVNNNKEELMDYIVSSIYLAHKNNIPNIELFNIGNTDYVIEINVDSYKENLEFIYDTYIKNEQYEYCPNVCKVLNKIK